MERLVRVRHVDADIIRLGIDARRVHLVLTSREPPRRVHGRRYGSYPQTFMPELTAALAMSAPIAPKADDAQRLAHKLSGPTNCGCPFQRARGCPCPRPLSPLTQSMLPSTSRDEVRASEDLCNVTASAFAPGRLNDDAAAAAILERDVVRAAPGARWRSGSLKGIAVRVGQSAGSGHLVPVCPPQERGCVVGRTCRHQLILRSATCAAYAAEPGLIPSRARRRLVASLRCCRHPCRVPTRPAPFRAVRRISALGI